MRAALMSFYVFMVVVSTGLVVGWIMNIIALSHASFSPISGFVILRIAGIFLAPLGGVLGWM